MTNDPKWESSHDELSFLSIDPGTTHCFLNFEEDVAVHLVGAATLNHSGYVRETALKCLSALDHPDMPSYEMDPQIRSACLEALQWVLEKHIPVAQMSPESLFQTVKYFLTEVPLFANTAGILKKKTSVFCYYQSIPFLENLYQNGYSFSVSPNQGFIEVDINAEHTNHTLDKELALRLDQSTSEEQIYGTQLS